MQLKFSKDTIKQVVLLKKYFNFSNIFNKAKANKLLEYLRHDLVIELIDDKQLFFKLIYNIFRIELEVMYKYINEMLAKRFI